MKSALGIPAMLLALAATASADRVDDVFQVWDANADGILTAEEITDAALFAKVDLDKNGKVTRDEVAKFLGLDAPAKPERKEAKKKAEVAKKEEKKEATVSRPMPAPVTMKDRVKDFFTRFDRNKDGKIQMQEFQGGEEQFKSFDRNRNKSLSSKEVQRFLQDQDKRARRNPRPDNFFQLFDRNRDGKVTRREYDGPIQFFRSYDHNKNNAVTMEELNKGPIMRNMPRANEPTLGGDGPTTMPKRNMLDRYDADKDGRITLEELNGAESILKRFDRNRDGVLSASEAK